MDAMTPDGPVISSAVLACSDFGQKLHETSLGRACMERDPSANACDGEKSRILGAEIGTSRACRSAMRMNRSTHVVGRTQLGGFGGCLRCRRHAASHSLCGGGGTPRSAISSAQARQALTAREGSWYVEAKLLRRAQRAMGSLPGTVRRVRR